MNAFTLIHVVFGAIGLLSGVLVLALKKGNILHRSLGQVFLSSMLASILLGIFMSYQKGSIFLLTIGVFSLYLVGTGGRFIKLKLDGEKPKARSIDWFLSLLMLIAGLVMLYLGGSNTIRGNNVGIVLLVFGLISLSGVWQDIRYYRGLERNRLFWLRTHISRMVGGFIAATTAFLVNNMVYLPDVIPGFMYWLLPTILLVPLIVKWQRSYAPNSKLHSGKKNA